jgi:hypothetical protein
MPGDLPVVHTQPTDDGMLLVELEQTCNACPAQWEGRTHDGKHVYIRYRWGWLCVGVGVDKDDAVDKAFDAPYYAASLGNHLDGFISEADMLRFVGASFRPLVTPKARAGRADDRYTADRR